MSKLRKELKEIQSAMYEITSDVGIVYPRNRYRYQELVRQADLLKFKIAMEGADTCKQ